jgi:hypothetical protein
MVKICRWWRELDNDGGCYEYCAAKEDIASCAGTRSQCSYPDHYDIQRHRLAERRAKDVAHRMAALMGRDRS